MTPLCVSPGLNAYTSATDAARRWNARWVFSDMIAFKRNAEEESEVTRLGPAEAKRRSVWTSSCRTPRSEMRPIGQRIGSLRAVNFTGCQGSD